MTLENGRRTDIEEKLIELGWGQPKKDPAVLCFQEYRPTKKINPHLPWEITMYHKQPLWRWDFVEPVIFGRPVGSSRVYVDVKLSLDKWITNIRSDFEFENIDYPDEVARKIDEQLTKEFDSMRLDEDYLWAAGIAVQRVTDRPESDIL